VSLALALLVASHASAQTDEPAPGPAPDVEQPAPEQQGRRVVVAAPLHRLELTLPAPYWSAQTGEELAQDVPGGCAAQQPSPNLLFVLRHKDALAEAWIVRAENTFLMRDRNDLEQFVGGFADALRSQLGEDAPKLETAFSERDDMIIHRISVTTSGGGTGGCAAPGQGGEAPAVRALIVDFFVRPEGEEATYFRASCRAPAETFAELETEFESILNSIRFTGQTAPNFFQPDAAVERVPTAEQAAKEVKGGRGSYSWILTAGLIMAIWLLLRPRRKKEA
jgi:hypothetical protein